MRIHCPNCQHGFTIPDELAEKQVSCPTCNHTFEAPVLLTGPETATYGVGPAEPRPPMFTAPTTSEPPRSVEPKSEPTAQRQAPPAESHRIALSKNVIQWFGPCGLVVALILSFFTWIAASPAGYNVYNQNAWQIMTGGLSADIPGEEVFGREEVLKTSGGFSWLMFLTLIPLLLAALLAATDLLEKHISIFVPDAIQTLYRKRKPILTGAAVGIFLLLSLQLIWGLGLESAAPAMAEKQVAKAFPKSEGEESAKQKYIRELRSAEEVARLGIRRTTALWLAWLACGAAAAGYLLESALTRRGDRPPPSIEISW